MQDYIYCGMYIPHIKIRATLRKDNSNGSFTLYIVGDHLHHTSLNIICKQTSLKKGAFFNLFKRALSVLYV